MNKQQVFELSLPEDQAIEFAKHVSAIRGQILKGNTDKVAAMFARSILTAHTDYATKEISFEKFIDEVLKVAVLHRAAIN